MPETESDHHRGDAAVARLDLVAPPPAAPATTARHDEEEEDGFTFAAVAVAVAVPRLQDADCAFPDARIGPVALAYPIFGRPRWSPPKQHQQEEEEEDPAGSGTATVRVPLGRLLLEDRWCECDRDRAPSSASGQQPADDADAELDGVPEDTYCLWSPGASPPPGSRRASPASCRKSESTGSPVLRWRRRRRQRAIVSPSHSDGKDKFVFLGAGEGHGHLMNRGSDARGGGQSTTASFLPCKQDLVGLVAGAVTFRRSYLPF